MKVTRIDPTKLTIGTDPMPAHRASPNKYADIFGRLKPGQCIICEPEQAAKLSTALKKYITTSAHSKCMVRSTSRFDADGKGRVWLIAPAAPAAPSAAPTASKSRRAAP